jgi:hypothetical protein
MHRDKMASSYFGCAVLRRVGGEHCNRKIYSIKSSGHLELVVHVSSVLFAADV